MKRIKCIKCNLRFKDREDPEDGDTVNKTLCMNCRFVWKCLGIMIQSFPESVNRTVALVLDHVIIRKDK